jgi:hypothetical protein
MASAASKLFTGCQDLSSTYFDPFERIEPLEHFELLLSINDPIERYETQCGFFIRPPTLTP